MNSICKYYVHLLKRNLISWRMLSVTIITVITMDLFLAGIRVYCQELHVKMSQWGFALLWNNKYLSICFLLIYLYAVTNLPESREKERYVISRIGVTKWIISQSAYLITFGWIYSLVLAIAPNILLWEEIEFMPEWGKGWATLSNTNVVAHYNIYVKVSHFIISNYEPIIANLLVLLIMGLLFGFIGLLSFGINFYSKTISVLVSCAVILMSFAAEKNNKLFRISPVSWITLNNHYSVLNTNYPKLDYIMWMLLLLSFLILWIVICKVGQTQENNRSFLYTLKSNGN